MALTKEQEELMLELEEEFKDRYTENDEFNELILKDEDHIPPIVKDWRPRFHNRDRSFNRDDRRNKRPHDDRNDRDFENKRGRYDRDRYEHRNRSNDGNYNRNEDRSRSDDKDRYDRNRDRSRSNYRDRSGRGDDRLRSEDY